MSLVRRLGLQSDDDKNLLQYWGDPYWADDPSPATRELKKTSINIAVKKRNLNLDADAAATLRKEFAVDDEYCSPCYANSKPPAWPMRFIEPVQRRVMLLKQLVVQVRPHLTKSMHTGVTRTVYSVVGPSGKDCES